MSALERHFDNQAYQDRNRDHYDTVFGRISVDDIVWKVRHFDAFLNDVTRTDTSWVMLYHGGLRERLHGATVLELGSGDGLNSLVMAAAGAEVVSIDISPVAAQVLSNAAKRLGLNSRVMALAGDFAELPLPGRRFDFVVGKAFLHHLTHEIQDHYLAKAAAVLRESGEARFAEPAVNSRLLEAVRWVVPVPGRPSILNRAAFREYQERDPHPPRDNSSARYRIDAERHFEAIEIVPRGAIQRLHRLLPQGPFNRSFRRFAFRAEVLLPAPLRLSMARAQLVICRQPRRFRSAVDPTVLSLSNASVPTTR